MQEDISHVIESDKTAHPNCSYSTSSSRRCTSVNGDFVCDIFKRIQRHCPGENPAEIFNHKETTTYNKGHLKSSGDVQNSPHDEFMKQPFFKLPQEEIFSNSLSPFYRDIIGDIFSPVFPGFPSEKNPPHRHIEKFPPHRHTYDGRDTKGSPGNIQISGPIEKI